MKRRNAPQMYPPPIMVPSASQGARFEGRGTGRDGSIDGGRPGHFQASGIASKRFHHLGASPANDAARNVSGMTHLQQDAETIPANDDSETTALHSTDNERISESAVPFKVMPQRAHQSPARFPTRQAQQAHWYQRIFNHRASFDYVSAIGFALTVFFLLTVIAFAGERDREQSLEQIVRHQNAYWASVRAEANERLNQEIQQQQLDALRGIEQNTEGDR
jgi:hypothetical protein